MSLPQTVLNTLLVSAASRPRCSSCANLMAAAGVKGVWLLHAGGWNRYSPLSFYDETILTLRGLR